MNVKVDTESNVTLPAAAKALQRGKSMQDIAAIMAENTMQMRGINNDGTPNEGLDDDDDTKSTIDADDVDTGDSADDDTDAIDDENGDALDDGAGDGADDDQGGEEEGSDEGREEDDEGEEGSGSDEDLEFEIEDTDLLELEDGTQVSIADLKELYQADDTISAAIEEQKAATNEALQMRAKAEDDAFKAQGVINAMMKHIVDVITVPLIGPPDENLKSSDPQQYIRHLDAYNQDQARIQQAQQDLAGAVNEFTEAQAEDLKTRRQDEMGVLVSKIPAMQNAETRPQASQDILDAAAHYGFTPDEVNNATDHRIYMLAYDAQQYRKLMKKTGKEEVDLTLEKAKTKVKQTRTLRSKGTTAKSRVSGQARRVATLKKKAANSGKSKDVAAYLAAKRQKP